MMSTLLELILTFVALCACGICFFSCLRRNKKRYTEIQNERLGQLLCEFEQRTGDSIIILWNVKVDNDFYKKIYNKFFQLSEKNNKIHIIINNMTANYLRDLVPFIQLLNLFEDRVHIYIPENVFNLNSTRTMIALSVKNLYMSKLSTVTKISIGGAIGDKFYNCDTIDKIISQGGKDVNEFIQLAIMYEEIKAYMKNTINKNFSSDLAATLINELIEKKIPYSTTYFKSDLEKIGMPINDIPADIKNMCNNMNDSLNFWI